ncbi:MAG: ComF family protein [Saprospiraceae bacterium]|nr:ComF family protein [Saprospiraceae bacterium]MCB0675352.1 ComF family protein [Saprospiraceae bacterium]MCB0679731.1 ComF family protein [Saprospiraceae bacterium]
MKTTLQPFQALLDLFYPRLCPSCGRELAVIQEHLCVSCRIKLPLTDHHLYPENGFTERFWGRLPLQAGAALVHFRKGGMVQRLIHELKYRGRKEIGLGLGRYLGDRLAQAIWFEPVEWVAPVPLHPIKLRKRGYNQAEWIARGVAESLGKPLRTDVLYRPRFAETQTRKSRMERVLNTESAFLVRSAAELQGRHLLLVDDVLTTGATLEACALALQGEAQVKISMATVAIADL